MFGRITYEMTASFWPFSRTLHGATWSNTTLVQGDLVEAVRDVLTTTRVSRNGNVPLCYQPTA